MRLSTVLASLATLAVLWPGAVLTPAAAYDTIDCARDQNAAERTICASQRLQVLDARVTEAYTDIMLDGGVRASIKQAVYDSQQNFLKRRDACGRDAECLAEVMSLRATRISYYR